MGDTHTHQKREKKKKNQNGLQRMKRLLLCESRGERDDKSTWKLKEQGGTTVKTETKRVHTSVGPPLNSVSASLQGVLARVL